MVSRNSVVKMDLNKVVEFEPRNLLDDINDDKILYLEQEKQVLQDEVSQLRRQIEELVSSHKPVKPTAELAKLKQKVQS